MVKFLTPQRFSKTNFSNETFDRFIKFLGPVQNFFGASTIQYLNLRILIQNNEKHYKIVNDYHHKYEYKINDFVKSALRAYSDGIFTLESHVLNNPNDNFEIDFEEMKIDKQIYSTINSGVHNKKTIGIMVKDLKINLLKSHKLFTNEDIYKYIYVKSDKYLKSAKLFLAEGNKNNLTLDQINIANELQILNTEIKPEENFEISPILEKYLEESKNKLTFMEGLGDHSLKYLQLYDPSDVPCDILVCAFVKDGEYNQQELSRPFNIWKGMERNFVKLYQTTNLTGDDGSTWFFAVFKKRMLIQKDREILELKNESKFFDEKVFKNYF